MYNAGIADEPIKPDPDKKPKRPRDTNQLAKRIVDLATGDVEDRDRDPEQPKNAAAQELSKLGASKGGKARASKLSAKERSEIARKAARARWSESD